MADGGKYIFKIHGYTPQTLPMSVLVKYLDRLATLFGNDEGVHFADIREGSAAVAISTDSPIAEAVDRRVESAVSSDAPADLADAVDEINELFRELRKDGVLLRAANDGTYLEIIRFSGEAAPEPKTYGPYLQATTIDAFLHRAGGKDPRLTLIDPERKQIPAVCTEDTLKNLRHHLHEWLRFYGEGKWFRTAHGTWQLRHFMVSNFEPIENESLLTAIERLRAIRGSDWDRMEDPLARAREMRDE